MDELKLRRILVTGANGFIGKNLIVRLSEEKNIETLKFVRGDSQDRLNELIAKSDAVIHLAGENRPSDINNFTKGNTDLTAILCEAIQRTGKNIPLILTSSTQAKANNPYGKSKLEAENLVKRYIKKTGNSGIIYRLPGVFGKWCKPNYNSVVATFCHNISRDLPIQINDPSSSLSLIYIDDLMDIFIKALDGFQDGLKIGEIDNTYTITLGALSQMILAFKNSRDSLISEKVGTGFCRALYATYISNLSSEQFSYSLPIYGDERGVFVEMLKTKDTGQFSFFTAHPGITRGDHYHHTKSEKFLVIKGHASFDFRHMITNETYTIDTKGGEAIIVETIPGWAHNITNIGTEEMVVMLWANEIFDRDRPDTFINEV